ncbi:nucleotidyl transferase AbiEii/AbiGii toxin family protein [Fulvivirgaceae bacterium PWU5]|uniref:Nucleotidyl transferase AbiEii/AbiGii toxin family protein n=1 Tax=Dawidia cretensis TaxID=2782350 RepID=A0AAP2E305_9BACT|nr:nucleotidyl transferase AbiEii/AbiGii toxin family protein [Dawidia cretensis]MBT1710614.1 nucleotidyl transferase AbiEii/AbiGii toxin family protein [Dawidia cretensis]
MLHSETVTSDLLSIAQQLCDNPRLNMFRIVGGTAISLHLGHRKSVDIDFFTCEKVNKRELLLTLRDMFPGTEFHITQHSISAEIKEMLINLSWETIEHAMINAAREFIASKNPHQEKKD